MTALPLPRPVYSRDQIARLQKLVSKTVQHNRVTSCINFLHEVFESAHLGQEAELYTVIGPSGVSKTTSVRAFVEAYPPYQKDIGDGRLLFVHPVIKIDVPPGVGKNGLWYEIVAALGRNATGIPRNADVVRTLARKALKQHGVKILIIDEAQNLIFNRTEKAIITANEVLRSLVNDNLCQVVLVGVEDLATLGQAEQSQAIKVVERQLARRIVGSLTMKPFDPLVHDDRIQFGSIVKALEHIACKDPKLAMLTDHLDELFQATGGATAELVKLITAAAKISYHDDRTFISKDDLLIAFANRKGERVANPFGAPAYKRAEKRNGAARSPDEKTSLRSHKSYKIVDFTK